MRRGLLVGIAMVIVAGLLLGGYAAPTLAKPVKIGGIFPQTGPYAAVGKTVTEGATLAVEEINQNGGIFGAPVEKYWRDDELKVQVALRRARELVETIGVDFFIGTIHVGIAAALNAYAKDAGAFYGCLCTTPPDMAKKGNLNPYTLLPFPRMSQMAGIPADVVAAKLKPKLAYIVASDYAYGWITSAVFKKRLEAHGVKVIGPEFHPLGATDFSPYIAKIMKLDPKPDILVSANFGMDFIHFVRQVYEFKLDIPILAASLTESFAKGVGPEGMKDVYGMMYYYYKLDLPQSKTFVEKYKAKYGYPPDAYAADGYHVTMLLLNAVKEIGTTDKKQLMAYFEGREITGLKGPERCRPKTHQFIQNIVIVRGKEPAKIKDQWDIFEVIDLAGYKGGEKYLLSYKELGWE